MLETNIRIVHPGKSLYVLTREGNAKGSDLSLSVLQKACGTMCHKHNLAAILHPSKKDTLLVATPQPVPQLRLEESDWVLDVVDAGNASQRITLLDEYGDVILPAIVERAFQVQLIRRTRFWRGDSRNIWYEPEPFCQEEGIDVYRRYVMGALAIDNVGIGLAVDVGTAFFSSRTLGYYFDPTVDEIEQRRRETEFSNLTNRQGGKQKGTLLYNNGKAKIKCYFVEAPLGKTCLTTGEIRINGRSWDSLADYYWKELPWLKFDENGRAVRVSLAGKKGKPVWVAAELIRIRVMNEVLPDRLRDIDKIPPHDRRIMLENFWNLFEPSPLGKVAPGFQKGFWLPSKGHVYHFPPSKLLIGRAETKQSIEPPTERSKGMYQQHYRQRLKLLEEIGCYSSPPAMTRKLHFMYPPTVDRNAVINFAADMKQFIRVSTGHPIESHVSEYQSVADAMEKLEREKASMVIFILNNEPAAHHRIAYKQAWRVKRITERVLERHYQFLRKGYWDKKAKALNRRLGQKRWDSFVRMNALSVLQLLDVVPYRLETIGDYEAMLAIDVGHDKRYFAISLLLARSEDKRPHFLIRTEVQHKVEHQHETINQQRLTDEILSLFKKVFRYRFDPISSLLVMRDGKFQRLAQDNSRFMSDETIGVLDAVNQLRAENILTTDSRVHLVDFHKSSHKSVRFWNLVDGIVENPLEGDALLLNKNTITVASTGRATLHQGTSQPFVVISNDHCPNVVTAAEATFAACQLNWFSPEVAQQLPLPIKLSDEELKVRATQEIKRYQ